MRWVRSSAIDGIGRVSLSLMAEWLRIPQTHWVLIFDHEPHRRFCLEWIQSYDSRPLKANFETHLLKCPAHAPQNTFTLPPLLKARQVTYFYSPYLFFVPLPMAIPKACTLHDLIPLRFPEAFAQASLTFRLALTQKKILKTILKRANRIFTVSQNTAQDLHALLNISPVQVVHWAAPKAQFRGEEPLAQWQLVSGQYLLCVSRQDPHKNLSILLKAYAQLSPTLRAEFPLVMVGPPHPQYDQQLKALTEDLQLNSTVFWLGAVDTQTLEALYHHCTLFAFPSLYEGFGLPLLEAMMAGAPVISSNRASLPEVAGQAAMLIDPEDISAWHQAIHHLLLSPGKRQTLRQAGFARASEFSWQQSAQTIRSCLTAVVA